ncbi:occludin/ELL domain-containing protein 1, partial [Talpa occidentalis]|uniref:occludin/ELL domain-containing protein 1 n=1 Tax=Talpa occidentalis TaxID=50954 RepID=UPI00188F3EB7
TAGRRRLSGNEPDSELRTLGQASRRPPPPRAGCDTARRTRPSARGRPNGSSPGRMPSREPPETRGLRGHPQNHPPGPGPPQMVSRGTETSTHRPLCQPQPRTRPKRIVFEDEQRTRPKRIVFEDELPTRALLNTRKPTVTIPGGPTPRPHSVPDYELKYPPVSNVRERRGYAAVFRDQYTEFLELQREVGSAQAKLRQLGALLDSLPPPQSQKEAQFTSRVWREFEKKQMDPSFLDKQARCCYLKSKLRHLKMQIQKFDNQEDSEGSVYF